MKVSVRQNRWGNWYGYVGARRVMAFAEDSCGPLIGSDTVCGTCGVPGASVTIPSEASRWLDEERARQKDKHMNKTIPSEKLGEMGTGERMRCGQCSHFIAVKPSKAINLESRNYGGWCSANTQTTAPELLRCGGDDFQRRADPFLQDQPR